jgi:hypothetical protein
VIARLAVLFGFGLLLRALFTFGGPDGGTCWHLGFQGDAPVWQDLAGRMAHGIADVEFLIPWRPPGMVYGIAWLWDGEGATAAPLRWLFVILGAAVAPLLWLLLRSRVAPDVAWIAACLTAAASNLLLLSSGLHAETPYLFLVLILLLEQERLDGPRAPGAALRWGLLNGVLCLLRAEHVLVVAALLVAARLRGARWTTLTLALLATAAPIAPWQWHANRMVADFNGGTPALPRSSLPWDDDAMAAIRDLPAFQQPQMFRFVADTMAVRGADRVRRADLEVIREAFGVLPEPLRPALIALQGGWSFWIANAAESDGGFTTAWQHRPPPLLGGPERYPAWLPNELPRDGAFALSYPPHLDLFVHGYARSFAEIAADPAGTAARLLKKLWRGLEGVAGGFGGAALPIGLSGHRRPVDMVVATGWWAACWRLGVLATAGYGLWLLRANRALWGLWAFAIARFAILLAYFGHARFGALCVPLAAIGVAAALHHHLARHLPGQRGLWVGAAFLLALVAHDAARVPGTRATVDDRPWHGPAGGVAGFQPHEIEFR